MEKWMLMGNTIYADSKGNPRFGFTLGILAKDDPMFDETKEFYYDTRTSERFCRKFSDWDELVHDVCCFVDKQMTFQNEAACRFQFSTNLTEDEFIDITTRIKDREEHWKPADTRKSGYSTKPIPLLELNKVDDYISSLFTQIRALDIKDYEACKDIIFDINKMKVSLDRFIPLYDKEKDKPRRNQLELWNHNLEHAAFEIYFQHYKQTGHDILNLFFDPSYRDNIPRLSTLTPDERLVLEEKIIKGIVAEPDDRELL